MRIFECILVLFIDIFLDISTLMQLHQDLKGLKDLDIVIIEVKTFKIMKIYKFKNV